MAYREVHMTEIKEILLRIRRKESVRSISKTLGIHRDTINKYIDICFKLGIDPKEDAITDELVEKISHPTSPGMIFFFPTRKGLRHILKKALKAQR